MTIQIRGGWSVLDYWKSGECQVVLERLSDMRKKGEVFNPTRDRLFKALQFVPFAEVRIMFIGQDPYPDPMHATGIAFDVDENIPLAKIPPTLKTIFKELNDDLHIQPKTGSLIPWCYEGVLLWNAIPSCPAFHSMGHDWPEWHLLTKEIIQKLSHRGQTVFVFLGNVAKRFSGYVEPGEAFLELSHPSPRASLRASRPFLGSRVFSECNRLLVEQGFEPIDWRL